jgi:FtsH ternary system domain X3-analog
MAEMTIRLRIDPNTGKKDIVVALRSDSDALPHEHEEQHRKLVEKLIEGGVLKAAEVGQIIVERVEEAPQPAPSRSEEPERGKQGAVNG